MRRNAFVVIVLLVVLGFVIWAILAQKGGVNFPGYNNSGNQNQSQTREPAPQNVAVPGVGGSAPENVAIPDVVGTAGNNTNASFRSFDIKASGNNFTPDTVIVKKGDTVHLNFITTDKKYDFTQPDYGFSGTPLPQGKTTTVQFQASASGKFKFYCQTCGGPAQGPVGYLIVTE